ncbi:MAG: chaperonin GroEL [Patescibacteria group bacterium]|nr:chaperonin GroEL [Patescibacteria group bacterium]MDE2015853.1 chaperonin GroEL [Patescibacteria group bacterium]MDE2227342.1 chaperonin GroEL [Patescibacteria group bacterium]
MKKTEILHGQKARAKILAGVNKMADTVTITLGLKGRNVAIAMQDFQGNIYKRDNIHDGVRVSKAIDLPDEFENMGAAIMREAAEKTVMEVGDGTTVTILLSQALYQEANKAIATGSDPVEIREGLEKAADTLVGALGKYAIPVKSHDQAKHIATISCQDPQIGEMIADTLYKIGAEGVATIEESKNNETTVDYQTGMQLEKGYYHPYFITDQETESAVLENPYILLTDKHLMSLEPLEKLLTEVYNRHAAIVFVCASFSGVTIPLLLQNKMGGKLNCLAIQAPSFGENQQATLEDIATLTGGKFIAEGTGMDLKDITLKELGRADYVTANKNSSLIVGGKGNTKDIELRVEKIKSQIETQDDEFKKEKLRERLGKLTNGIAVIHVGGYTEIEMKDRKEKIIDAVSATRAAMKKGIVPGGEIIYLKLREMLGNSIAERIMYKVLERPFNKLVENAGLDSGQMRERLRNVTTKNAGVDLRDNKIKDMVKAGIIDPLLVVESALYNSVSVANALILTEAIIVPKVDKK